MLFFLYPRFESGRVFFSLFTVFNARSDERSAFAGLFSNESLWGAVLLSLLLQVAIIDVPFCSKRFRR
jgi:P-type Ca2+ transporter type 2C